MRTFQPNDKGLFRRLLKEDSKSLEELMEQASVLDRYYIPTRYPNGLPDLTPGKCYFRKDALLCMDAAQRLLDQAVKCMEI